MCVCLDLDTFFFSPRTSKGIPYSINQSSTTATWKTKFVRFIILNNKTKRWWWKKKLNQPRRFIQINKQKKTKKSWEKNKFTLKKVSTLGKHANLFHSFIHSLFYTTTTTNEKHSCECILGAKRSEKKLNLKFFWFKFRFSKHTHIYINIEYNFQSESFPIINGNYQCGDKQKKDYYQVSVFTYRLIDNRIESRQKKIDPNVHYSYYFFLTW